MTPHPLAVELARLEACKRPVTVVNRPVRPPVNRCHVCGRWNVNRRAAASHARAHRGTDVPA